MALSNFIIFHHLKANILRFAHLGNFLSILLSFVEKKLVNKGSILYLLTWYIWLLLLFHLSKLVQHLEEGVAADGTACAVRCQNIYKEK